MRLSAIPEVKTAAKVFAIARTSKVIEVWPQEAFSWSPGPSVTPTSDPDRLIERWPPVLIQNKFDAPWDERQYDTSLSSHRDLPSFFNGRAAEARRAAAAIAAFPSDFAVPSGVGSRDLHLARVLRWLRVSGFLGSRNLYRDFNLGLQD
ncbi:hypothetical protein MLD38_015632 [Melastoma candidum]|uniref:Uncharacterized protein n=1 Tax=Melastoma candidum TaxID=119954 RepID=A0ACB9RGW8_9MYRT|nr:hypothetical protein MLD38_015632 [Melastoma candidum]